MKRDLRQQRFLAAGFVLSTALAVPALAGTAGAPAEPPAAGPQPQAEESERGDLIRARENWFRQTRSGPSGVIPFRARQAALEQLQQNLRSGLLKPSPKSSTLAGGGQVSVGPTWTSLGPEALVWEDGVTPYSGRATAIATHPSNPNIVYVGTAQGGVWKTMNAGGTWTPLTDDQKSLAIGSIAIDPSNANRIYVGTGEPYDNCGPYFGSGILRSDDAGATWTLLGESVFSGTSVSKIVVHPTTPATLWAASAQGTAGFICTVDPGPNTYGVRKSTDGGATWNLVLGTSQTGLPTYTYDLVIDPSNPDVLYAGVGAGGVWKTVNGGTSWTRLAGGLPTSDLGRVDLAIKRDTPQTLYAVFEKGSTSKQLGTLKSTNGGTTWTQLPAVTPGDTCMLWAFNDICTYSDIPNIGWCNYALYVEVAADGTVWLGGNGLWRSTNGGTSWIDSCPTEMHVDQHAAAFASNGSVWVGNDGGVSRSDDNGATWINRSRGLVTAQFYPGGSLHPTRRDFALGGTQDNGTFRYSGTSTWPIVYRGDGGFSAVDFSNPDNVWYVTAQYLVIYKTTNGGATVSLAVNGLADAGSLLSPFIAPIAMCPANSSLLVAGSDNVWITTDGAANWQQNSRDPLLGFLQTIQSIAFAPSDATCNTYFLGLTYGRVYRTTTRGGLTGWTEITGSLPLRGVSDLAVDSANGNIVYAALSGFGTPHVFKTTNALGATPAWTSISTGLPDTPVDAILIDPNDHDVLYIGTDVGIFRSEDAGASWSLFMDGHPNVAVFDLAADASTGSLLSFTYGRGVYRANLPCEAVPCGDVGNTLLVSKNASSASLSWNTVACGDLASYEVYGSPVFDAPFPGGWTLIGTPASPAFSDPLASPYQAYKAITVDQCGNKSPD